MIEFNEVLTVAPINGVVNACVDGGVVGGVTGSPPASMTGLNHPPSVSGR